MCVFSLVSTTAAGSELFLLAGCEDEAALSATPFPWESFLF